MKISTRKRKKGEGLDAYIESVYETNKGKIDSILSPDLAPTQSAKTVFTNLVKTQQETLRDDGRRADAASAIKSLSRTRLFDKEKSYAAENFLRGLQKRGRLDEFAEMANIRIQKRVSGRFAGYTKGQNAFDPKKLVDVGDNAFIYDNRVRIDYDGSLDQIILTELI